MVQNCLKLVQIGPKMVHNLSKSGKKMVQNRSKAGQKLVQNGSKTGRKRVLTWSKSCPKLVQKLVQNCPKLIPNWSKNFGEKIHFLFWFYWQIERSSKLWRVCFQKVQKYKIKLKTIFEFVLRSKNVFSITSATFLTLKMGKLIRILP